jgi:hypothetical protein
MPENLLRREHHTVHLDHVLLDQLRIRTHHAVLDCLLREVEVPATNLHLRLFEPSAVTYCK